MATCGVAMGNGLDAVRRSQDGVIVRPAAPSWPRHAAIARRKAVIHRIAQVALLVREYDEAIRFYTRKLGFVVLEDTDLGRAKRWVRIAASPRTGSAGTAGVELLLARAATPEQESRVGNQTGGRVFLFLETDDFPRDHRILRDRGVAFAEAPREEPYGTVAVLLDLYGNRIDLIQPRQRPASP